MVGGEKATLARDQIASYRIVVWYSVGMRRLSEELSQAITEEALPIGTVRQWKSGEMIKTGPNKWRRNTAGARKQIKKRQETAKLKSTIGAFKDAIASGEAGSPGMTFKDHVREAKASIGVQSKRFDGLMGDLRSMAPKGATVLGRVKKMESVLGKIIRKPKTYKSPADLQDVTGTRIIANSIGEVQDTVNKIKKRFKVVDEDDYISKPQGDYRSHHLIIEDDDGYQKEVQVRTRNQDTFANWSHDVYKPQTPDQEAAVRDNKDKVNAFSKGMSEFFYAQDMGKSPPPPPRPKCPPEIVKSLGCI